MIPIFIFILEKKVIKEDGSSSGSSENESASGQETGTNYMSDLEMSIGTDNHTTERHVSPKAPFQHYGSFYLRMGAVGEFLSTSYSTIGHIYAKRNYVPRVCV